MKRHPVFPVWFTGLSLAVVGGGSLVFRAEFATSTAWHIALGEHLARSYRKMPEGSTVVAQPPFVIIGGELPAQIRVSA